MKFELNLRKNLSNTDRLIRLIISLMLIGLAYFNVITGTVATIAVLIAVFQFIESFLGY